MLQLILLELLKIQTSNNHLCLHRSVVSIIIKQTSRKENRLQAVKNLSQKQKYKFREPQ